MLVCHPATVLLAVQLFVGLLYPLADTFTWLAIALGVSALALSVVDALCPNPTLSVVSAALHALFYFWPPAT